MKIMCDYDGTFMVPEGQRSTESILHFPLVRMTVAFLSWFKIFSSVASRRFIPNHDLIARINRETEWGTVSLFFVSGRGSKNMPDMIKHISATDLDFDKIKITIILRDNIFERHSEFKKKIAEKIAPDVILEDCHYYRKAMASVASEKTLILSPNWRIMAR